MRICVLNTGGTISSVGQPLAPMPAKTFAEAARRLLMPSVAARWPDMQVHFDTSLRFSDHGSGMLDSTDLQPTDWCRIAGAVLDAYDDHDGFVILHGTDTMDYTGAALPLLLNVFDDLGIGRAVLSKPVILTGAQLPLFHETAQDLVLNAGSDGFANLCGALAAALLRLPEVGLFFDGKLLRGSRALKVSTSRFDGFGSPHLPPLAEIGIGARVAEATPLPGPAAPHLSLDDPAARKLAQDQLRAVRAGIDDCPVIQLPAFPMRQAASPAARMIADAVAAGMRGIVLQAHGEGNFPSGNPANPEAGPVAVALKAAVGAGVTVLDCSRAIGGEVADFHYAAGAWIAATGAISGQDMTPVAGFAKLMVLLAAAPHHGWSDATLRALMQCDLTGECRGADRLDSRRNPVLLPGQKLACSGGSASLVNDPRSGIALIDAKGAVLWQPAPGKPGRLILTPEGRLSLRSPDGGTPWQAGPLGGADALLILSADPSGAPLLDLHDAGSGTRLRLF